MRAMRRRDQHHGLPGGSQRRQLGIECGDLLVEIDPSRPARFVRVQ
jgi:hypothetical protein